MCGDIILGRKGDFRDRQPVAVPPDDVPLDHSLSAYLSVIYLEPKMKIFIEQRPVQVNHLADALKAKKTYKVRVAVLTRHCESSKHIDPATILGQVLVI